jgi:hypothetical protein
MSEKEAIAYFIGILVGWATFPGLLLMYRVLFLGETE